MRVLSSFDSFSRASPAVNGRLWPCGWHSQDVGVANQAHFRYHLRGVAGTEPPEGLLGNGDLRRDGHGLQNHGNFLANRAIHICDRHVEFFRDKKCIYLRGQPLMYLLFCSF